MMYLSIGDCDNCGRSIGGFLDAKVELELFGPGSDCSRTAQGHECDELFEYVRLVVELEQGLEVVPELGNGDFELEELEMGIFLFEFVARLVMLPSISRRCCVWVNR